MIKCPYNQPMHISGKHLGGILDGLSSSDLDVILVQEKRISTELVNTYFKGNARPGARFREDHGPGLVLKHRRGMSPPLLLETLGQRKDFSHFMRLEIRFFQKVLH